MIIMKKIMILLAVAMMTTLSVNAQSAIELAKQQRELNDINMKLLNAKPSKDAKKQAKEFKKQGWQVNAGDNTIEKQITESQLMSKELMVDEAGNRCTRYIQAPGQTTAGSFNVAYAAARNNATVQLAATLEQQVAAAMQTVIDNAQSSSISAVTVDKFHERAKTIVDASLSNSIPVLCLYRVLNNGNFEVMVRMAYDKKEFAAKLKRKMQKELEIEGDELNKLVDQVLQQN